MPKWPRLGTRTLAADSRTQSSAREGRLDQTKRESVVTNGNGQRVALVVEDVGWIRAEMARQLEARGYEVVSAADAAEAMRLAERNTPTVILTEEDLPTFDELVGSVQAHPSLRDVPIVIVNPDPGAEARGDGTVVLPDYDQIERLLS
jgi:PleD family two-component response regulator